MKIWTRAAELASSTPPSRNRYVDFLRAVSILVVIFGHWTAAAPYVNAEGAIAPTHILAVSPWTRWLTWLIQVMPIFFLVGGYSNGISWHAAQRDKQTYALWLESRLRRLVGPVLTLIVTWCALGALAHTRSVSPAMIRIGSQMALIPIWFLAVYLGVVVLVPVTHSLWERFGMRSYWALALCAVAIDASYFAGVHWLGWTNYLFVWSAVHQLGYAWRDGQFADWKRTLPWAAGGAIVLVALTVYGPYPVSMVGVPGDDISNTTPPKITLLALGALQLGLLLSLEAPVRRWLARAAPWTATVLINGMIMTIYLWHLTAMVLVIALSSVLGGIGLRLAPGTRGWWMTRPLWHAVLVVALIPLALVFSRFERPGKARGELPAAWRLVVGALAVSFGMAFLALDGVAGQGWFGLRLTVIAMPLAGAALMRRWSGATTAAT